jgi:hypothetical protein
MPLKHGDVVYLSEGFFPFFFHCRIPVCMSFVGLHWINLLMCQYQSFFWQEYNVRANSVMDKTYSIGRFVTGLPPFSKKKNAENKWSLHKEGLQGRQIAENMRVCIIFIFSFLLYN